jgi:Ni,Fe-hydrogenase III small subunit
MLHELMARMKQGYRTTTYPETDIPMMDRFRGYPELRKGKTPEDNERIAGTCPFGALSASGGLSIDLGACLFCSDCPAKESVVFGSEPDLAVSDRKHLIVRAEGERKFARPLPGDLLKLFGRSLKLREVSAGGCNACEADTNVLSTIGWDLGRFGVQFVASPRHADGLWVTGPVSNNMKEALLQTYEAIPAPKIVIACGACAIGGGPFRDFPSVENGVADLLPVDLFIPGCPPHPVTILDGILRILSRK